MLNEIRTIVTAGYELLTHNKDFALFKRFKNSKALHSEEFLIHYSGLEESVYRLRSILTKLSTELENAELLASRLHLNIERDIARKKAEREALLAERAKRKEEKELKGSIEDMLI